MNTDRIKGIILILSFLAGILLFISRCSLGGSGTESTNPLIYGHIYNADGTPAENVKIYLRPRSTLGDTTMVISITPDTDSTLTDSDGLFEIPKSLWKKLGLSWL